MSSFIPTTSFSQDIDEKMHEILSDQKYYSCNDYAYNMMLLIPRYYKEQKPDSIFTVLKFYEKECRESFNSLRVKILINILNGSFTEDIYDKEIIIHLTSYRSYYDRYLADLDENCDDCERSKWHKASDYFDRFTLDAADDVLRSTQSGTVENLWGLFYAGDFLAFFEELKSKKYYNTKLREYYYQKTEELLESRGSQTHYGLPIGVWYPTGNLYHLGQHPDIGFIYGLLKGKDQVDLNIGVRFGKAKNKYYIQNNNGVMEYTDEFSNVYLGLEYNRQFLKSGSFELWLMTGLAYEAIQTVDDSDDKERKLSLETLNLNAGLESKLFLNKYKTRYISLYAKFNGVNFNTKAGTDLSGNVVTYGIRIGFLSMGYSNKMLERLNYFD